MGREREDPGGASWHWVRKVKSGASTKKARAEVSCATDMGRRVRNRKRMGGCGSTVLVLPVSLAFQAPLEPLLY